MDGRTCLLHRVTRVDGPSPALPLLLSLPFSIPSCPFIYLFIPVSLSLPSLFVSVDSLCLVLTLVFFLVGDRPFQSNL